MYGFINFNTEKVKSTPMIALYCCVYSRVTCRGHSKVSDWTPRGTSAVRVRLLSRTATSVTVVNTLELTTL